MPPAYTKIRDGIVDSTKEIVKGKVFADYDGDGKLLGVEFLTTVNNVKVPDSNMPPYMNSGKSWTISLASLLIACCATAHGQCYINAQGQTVCPNRPAIYGATHPFQTRVQVTPTYQYSGTSITTSAPRSVSYGSTGGYRSANCTCDNCTCGMASGYISNVKDITEQRKAELKELGQLRAYKKTAEKQLKALRAENSVLRANAQPGAARVPTQEPARVGLPTELTLPKVSLRLPPSTGLTLPPQTMLAQQ